MMDARREDLRQAGLKRVRSQRRKLGSFGGNVLHQREQHPAGHSAPSTTS